VRRARELAAVTAQVDHQHRQAVFAQLARQRQRPCLERIAATGILAVDEDHRAVRGLLGRYQASICAR